MIDPTPQRDFVRVEDLTLEDVAADTALFLEGDQDVDGIIVATATAHGSDVVLSLEDGHDGTRTFRLRVLQA